MKGTVAGGKYDDICRRKLVFRDFESTAGDRLKPPSFCLTPKKRTCYLVVVSEKFTPQAPFKIAQNTRYRAIHASKPAKESEVPADRQVEYGCCDLE
jgi:hypothetical protein